MSESAPDDAELVRKIARLVEERGWNQEDLVRHAQLNRQTVRQIMQYSGRRLRNATVSRIAHALGLPVGDLRGLPLDRLLPRVNGPLAAAPEESVRRLYERASQPELTAWLERNPERARQLGPQEIDELLSLQGTGGPLNAIGVEHFVGLIERKRKLLDKVQAIAGTEYLELLEKLVELLFEKVQPYANRK